MAVAAMSSSPWPFAGTQRSCDAAPLTDRPPRYESGLFESFEKALDPNEIFSPSRGPVLCDTPANF